MTHGSHSRYGYSDGLPSYRAKLPQPLIVVLRDSDGSVLEQGGIAVKGFELTQEVLQVVCGQFQVHKGSYITIERED